MGYLRWAPNVTGEKMEITFFPDRGSNPVRWTQSPTLYHVAIKAGLYRKAVQVYHIPIPGDKHFSCSTQLSKKFSLLINIKMPTVVAIFIFISREFFMLSCFW